MGGAAQDGFSFRGCIIDKREILNINFFEQLPTPDFSYQQPSMHSRLIKPHPQTGLFRPSSLAQPKLKPLPPRPKAANFPATFICAPSPVQNIESTMGRDLSLAFFFNYELDILDINRKCVSHYLLERTGNIPIISRRVSSIQLLG